MSDYTLEAWLKADTKTMLRGLPLGSSNLDAARHVHARLIPAKRFDRKWRTYRHQLLRSVIHALKESG